MTHYRPPWIALLILLLGPVAVIAEPAPPDERAVEVRFLDDSVLRVLLADEPIEIATKHGKLQVPADQIKRVYFAQRIDAKTQGRIDRAVAALIDPEAAEAAGQELLQFKEQSYHALRIAARARDRRRAVVAARLLDRLEKKYPARVASLRETDLLETDDGKIVGQLTAKTLRIETRQFGELTMKIADARSMRSQSLIDEEPEPEPDEVSPDPGNMKAFEAMVGKTFRFRVTGKSASCWGTDVYTTDSPLCAAAVHAGVLKIGETGVVEVEVVAPLRAFTGTNRNGITTANWGSYPGAYKIIKPKLRKPRE